MDIRCLAIVAILMLPCSCYAVASLKIQSTTSEDDLNSFKVWNSDNHSSFSVYFSEDLENVASQAIPTLNLIYTSLSANVGLSASEVDWAEVAFVNDESYIPPRQNGKTRWVVVHPSSNSISTRALKDLYTFIGHEQTHSIQNTISCDVPRWFEEGQAMWNEQKTTKAWDERVAREERQRYQTAFQNLVGELNLDNWGAMQVKPDAIERQLTPEQKKKKQQDPSYSPPGPFSFGPDDIVSDESNTSARYFVSLTIFEFLEEKLGLKKLQEAFNDIRKSESCSSAELKELIRYKYNTDISSFFK